MRHHTQTVDRSPLCSYICEVVRRCDPGGGLSRALTVISRVCLCAALVLAGCTPSPEELAADNRAVVSQYCLDCHNDLERTGNLSLESQDFMAVAAHADVWEKVVRKLRAGMMPPQDGGQPLEPERRAVLVSWLEGELDRAATDLPNPGRTVPFHRLNRSEYRNAVRDLLALDVDIAELLPADEASYGFDNIAGVLKLSPSLLERYIEAADKVSRLAVGTPSPFAAIDYFRVPDDRSQERRLPNLPFGTRGGIAIEHTFPRDGDYVISTELQRTLNEGMPVYPEAQDLEVSVDGERVGLFTLPAATLVPLAPANDDDDFSSEIPPPRRTTPDEQRARNRADEDWEVRVPIKAGPHRVVVTFLAKAAALQETARMPFERPYPLGLNIPEGRSGSYLRSVEISGPYDTTGPGDTASRARLFTCRPTDEGTATGNAEQCAAEILAGVARRAYRRPIEDADVESLLAFYRLGSEEGGFDFGIQLALKRLLVNPEFLFRFEHDPAGVAPDETYRVRGIELASRLSFFVWSSIPDDELLAAAERGALEDPDELERQVERMLADPKADAFVDNFAGQWLFLRNLNAVVPVQTVFPDFDDTLREGLRRETELFFASIVRENRSVLDLLRADYTYLNERVARHYGIPNIKGSHFRRVTLPADSGRRGLLGHGSILAATSLPNRTSPVVRGKWILENLLGTPPPPPPANVPPLGETDGSGTPLSMRERLAAHRSNPTCASCHTIMDPLGFALENFDAVGAWRTLDDSGAPIDASGVLPDGTSFASLEAFRESLLSSDLFVQTLTEKLLTYALGRGVEPYDMPAVRGIVRDAADDDYRFSSFILGVVESTPFTMRRAGS